MLTLIDSLDSLLLFCEYDLFFDALDKLKNLSFHRNIEVSVFEVNIRVLGGLLSSHQLANKLFGENSNTENHGNEQENDDDEEYYDNDENDANNCNKIETETEEIRSEMLQNKEFKNTKKSKNTISSKIQNRNYTYDGNFLLNYAIDLGDRMLPAFRTLSGIPIQRINLLQGKNSTELSYTCTAAGSTFLLEMGLLSRLTGKGIIYMMFSLYYYLYCYYLFYYYFVLLLFIFVIFLFILSFCFVLYIVFLYSFWNNIHSIISFCFSYSVFNIVLSILPHLLL